MKMKTIITSLTFLSVVGAGFHFYPDAKPSGSAGAALAAGESGEKQLWTCGMHPNVVLDHPGICPICEMKLTPLKPDNAKGSGTISIDPTTRQNIGVRTAIVERTDLTRTIRSNGKVLVDESRTYIVNPKVSGWIEILYVDETGAHVTKGQPLFKLYSPELLAAQEEYLIALANYETAESATLPSLLNSSRKMLDATRERLLNWDLSVAQIERLEEQGVAPRLVTYYSPANGVVMHKNAVEGAHIAAGADLYTIANLNSVWIEADIYEYELPWIEIGQTVAVTPPYNPAVHFMSQISYIYPYLNPANRTAKIRLEVDNPNLELKPDMYVDLKIKARELTNVVALPREAVIRSGRRDLVFLDLGEGEFKPREVQLGLEADHGLQEITSGLEAGETVVTSAQFLLDSERQLKEALEKLLAGGGSEADMRKAMGHSSDGSDNDPKSSSGTVEAAGSTMEVFSEGEEFYQCPDHDQIITADANTHCPHDQQALVKMTAEEIAELRASDPYGCVMCPVIYPGSEKDQRCSICNMKLKPVSPKS